MWRRAVWGKCFLEASHIETILLTLYDKFDKSAGVDLAVDLADVLAAVLDLGRLVLQRERVVQQADAAVLVEDGGDAVLPVQQARHDGGLGGHDDALHAAVAEPDDLRHPGSVQAGQTRAGQSHARLRFSKERNVSTPAACRGVKR